MKSIQYPIAVATAFIITSPAFAQGGSNAGNGGNVVVCFNNPKDADALTIPGQLVSRTIPDEYLDWENDPNGGHHKAPPYRVKSIETLDLYEAKNGYFGEEAKTPVSLRDGENENDYVARIADRFLGWEKSEALRTMILKGRSSIQNISYISDPSLIPAADITPILKARPGCVYATMARQKDHGFVKEIKSLTIDKRLYTHPLHSIHSRGVLLLHEYVLSQLGLSHDSTDAVRVVVGNLIAQDASYYQIALTMKNTLISKERPTPLMIAYAKTIGPLRGELDRLSTALKSKSEIQFIRENFHRHSKRIQRAYRDQPSIYKYVDLLLDVGYINQILGRDRMTEDEKATVQLLKNDQTEYVKNKLQELSETFASEHRSEWEEAIKTSLQEIRSLRISEDRLNRIQLELESFNIFDLKQNPNDMIQSQFQTDQIFFPY